MTPIAIEQGYLEGRGLTRLDPSEFDGENVTRDEDFTSDSADAADSVTPIGAHVLRKAFRASEQ